MLLRTPRSTHTDTLFPYTTLFRSEMAAANNIRDNERRNRFRAIEFHKGQAEQEILLSLIRKQNAGERTAAYALMLVDPESVPQTRSEARRVGKECVSP